MASRNKGANDEAFPIRSSPTTSCVRDEALSVSAVTNVARPVIKYLLRVPARSQVSHEGVAVVTQAIQRLARARLSNGLDSAITSQWCTRTSCLISGQAQKIVSNFGSLPSCDRLVSRRLVIEWKARSVGRELRRKNPWSLLAKQTSRHDI